MELSKGLWMCGAINWSGHPQNADKFSRDRTLLPPGTREVDTAEQRSKKMYGRIQPTSWESTSAKGQDELNLLAFHGNIRRQLWSSKKVCVGRALTPTPAFLGNPPPSQIQGANPCTVLDLHISEDDSPFPSICLFQAWTSLLKETHCVRRCVTQF